MLRECTTRPAIPTVTPVVASASRSPHSARTSGIVCVIDTDRVRLAALGEQPLALGEPHGLLLGDVSVSTGSTTGLSRLAMVVATQFR